MNKSYPQHVRDEDEIDLLALLATFYANKLLIIGCILLFGAVAYLYVQGQRPVYEANALIHIEPRRSGGLGLDELTGIFESESGVAAEIEIIKSRFVLGQVVDNQSLQAHAIPRHLPLGRYFPVINDYLIENATGDKEYSRFDGILTRFNKADAEIEIGSIDLSSIKAPRSLTLIRGPADVFTVWNEVGEHLYTGTIGITPDIGNSISMQVEKIETHIGAEFGLFISRRIDAIRQLRSRLKIIEKGKNTGILSISLESTDHYKADDILDEILETYANQNKKRLSQEAERSIDFLHNQVPRVKASLEAAEDEVSAYRAKSSRVGMQIETETVLNKIVAIEGRLNELKLKENEISGRYKKDHPIYVTLIKQRNSLLQEKERIDHQIEKLPLKQQELLGLMRNVEVNSAVYLQLRNKMEELKVVRAGTVGNVRILDQAEVLPEPVKPKKAPTVLLASIIGGFIGMVLTLLRVWLNAGLKNPKEIEEKVGLPNYGVIPFSRSQQKIDKDTLQAKNQPGMLVALDAKDTALESIRSIRTSLHFAMMEAKNNIVALTSSAPGVGKSFVSTNLAALIAQSGQKVLLIDMDMRRGHIHKTMCRERAPGLSNLLSEGIDSIQVVHKAIIPNMDFIGTGDIPPNPSELLMSKAYTDFIDQIRQYYDIVIADTPPALAVTDAALIGRQAGTNLLVVKHNKNSLREVQQTQQEFGNLDVTLKGYIYNFYEKEPNSRYAYNYNYYYYDYRNKYKKEVSKWPMQGVIAGFWQRLKGRS